VKAFIAHTRDVALFPAASPLLEAAIAGVRAAGWAHDAMPFTASTLPPKDECERRIEESDVVLFIIGPLRGSIVKGLVDKSYVEFEYEFAGTKLKDRLCFVVDDNFSGYPVGLIKRQLQSDEEAQDRFRRLVDSNSTCYKITDASGLRDNVQAALESLRTEPLPDYSDLLAMYRRLTARGEYDAAFSLLSPKLEEMDFGQSRNHELLDLLGLLFPSDKGFKKDPLLTAAGDRAIALNFVARGLKNVGQPKRAVDVLMRGLSQHRANDVPRFFMLANLVNLLRLTGEFARADLEADHMVSAANNLREVVCEAYSLYWCGVLRADCGDVDAAVSMLRQAQILFERIPNKGRQAAGLGRTYAHLAQVELWLGHPAVALTFATRGLHLASVHRQPRESVFCRRLIGTAWMRLRDVTAAVAELTRAIEKAESCKYREEQRAATIALAESLSWNNQPDDARYLLSDELRRQAADGGLRLLLADYYNTKCILQQAEGRQSDAIRSAHAAYEAAWCSGPGAQYHWGLETANKHLRQLGAEPGIVAAPNPHLEHVKPQMLFLNAASLARASSRVQFTRFLRNIKGDYRYAPTKFAMLFKSWTDVRRIVMGRRDPKAVPHFIEIHLDNNCNLSCRYCRGELRPVDLAVAQRRLDEQDVVRLIDDLIEMNPEVFVRFSGLIGEPLAHPRINELLSNLTQRPGLQWGLTTNGLLMNKVAIKPLLSARYVHFSVDAGSDNTYRLLKEPSDGRRGSSSSFTRVMDNIDRLRRRRGSNSTPEIIVSCVLQEENCAELPVLAAIAKEKGADSLEVKMQHFDTRRGMTEAAVRSAFAKIEEIRRMHAGSEFRVIAVQNEADAIAKIQPETNQISFNRCYANELGLSATVAATAELNTCCQYYQATLGSVGDVSRDRFRTIWFGTRRREALKRDAKVTCVNCSPSDDFVNRFVQFLADCHASDTEFLNWVEYEVGLKH
jgi:MoaA/NifB/PqqE/SkfB family radical SAM enzyme/tetratricopeptide (TPR) repeat protein